MKQSVLFEVVNHIGWISLNRPNVINSLNTEMVHLMKNKLEEWREDDRISFVCISGEGEKGLCAGGDMKALYDRRDLNVQDTAFDFFLTEYLLDIMIHHYSKPVLVYMNGIVMGGGVGLSAGATHRIVTERTKWAMPEMNIGFFPDVGASYFLNKMPGYIGHYLALTSDVIEAHDIIFSGNADFYMDSQDWVKLKSEILNNDWKIQTVDSELTTLINQFSHPISNSSSRLAAFQDNVNHHFSRNTMEEILLSLEKGEEQGNQWAFETKSMLLSKSPTSLKVTLRQLQQGKKQSLVDCFKMEFALSMNFMNNPDFYEGVRSVLVDKDRTPHWKSPRLEDVSEDYVLSFFEWDEKRIAYKKFDKLNLQP